MSGRTLVIDTATAACSVALFEGGALIAHRHDLAGRGHAERLVPMIAALPDGGRAETILVDVGPGSFTGVRVGIAAARGLALGWSAQATGYSSLAAIAAAAFARAPAPTLAVVLEAGHGEVFMQAFTAAPFAAASELAALRPADALAAIGELPAIGAGTLLLGADRASSETLPDAAEAMMLPLTFRSLPPRPLYGRAPDAKPVLSDAAGGVEGPSA